MAFSESLTVRILADSSQLRQELSGVAQQLDDLERRLAEATDAGRRFSDSFSRLSAATRPLQQLSSQFSRLSQQLRTLSNQPITLNVQPALRALQQLMLAAEQAAARLQALGTANMAAAAAGMMRGGNPPVRRRMAAGGVVSGPSGVDRVPARLTAGEFVFSRDAVASLGVTFLDRLHRQAMAPSRAGTSDSPPLIQPAAPPSAVSVRANVRPLLVQPELPQVRQRGLRQLRTETPLHTTRSTPAHPVPPVPPVQQTNNQFGGIEIHVREAADVDALVDDLHRRGIASRHRWG